MCKGRVGIASPKLSYANIDLDLVFYKSKHTLSFGADKLERLTIKLLYVQGKGWNLI
jgi:hypothetical protein